MESSSKILTVSYGTFSCTLEGFDDPFTTLQKVAEYFRQLAERDRFFGGQPLVPEISRLQEIAEETNPNAVDTEIGDNGIVLRQKPDPQPEEFDLTAVPGETIPQMVFSTTSRKTAEDESVAPLSLLADQIVAEAPVEAEPDPDLEAFDRAMADMATEDGETPEDDQEKSTALLAAEEEAEAAHQEALAASEALKSASDEGEARKLKKKKHKAKKLAREKKRIAELEAEAAQTSDEEPKQSVFHSRRAQRRLDDDPDSNVLILHQAEKSEKEDSDSAARLAVARTLAEIRQNVENAENEIESTESRSDDVQEILADSEETDTGDTGEEVEIAAELRLEEAEDDEQAISATDQAANIESSLSEEEEADLANELASALEEIAEPEIVKEETPEPEADEQQKIRDKRSRRRNLAAAMLRRSESSDEDQAIDRLLEATQTKMDGPAHTRRQQSIGHMKAAVAATEAENEYSENGVINPEEEKDDLAAYREDLKRAQRRSRNPKADAAPAARSAIQTPPPLVLVSEQRIDNSEPDAPGEVEPERPREVAELDGNLALKPEATAEPIEISNGIPAEAFDESTSFRDFADRIGALELQDLLEAAAAYTTIVEGKPRFSRAQVMSKLAKISVNSAFSKEAGLRSFGRLLREGKILRVQDGQFAISKSSRFSLAARR